MAKATADYSALVERSEAFTKAAEDLETLLTTFTSEAARLQTVSEALAKLLWSAEGSLPQVEQKVLALTSQLTNAVMENQKQVGTALTANATATRNALQSVHDTVSAKTLELTSQLTQAVTENQKQVGRALTENATAIRNTLQSANESMASAHKEQTSQIAGLVQKTKDQVTVLDKALSEELEKLLVSLGRNLTVLSERFVEDYTPLTEKLRRVVELSSRVVEMAR